MIDNARHDDSAVLAIAGRGTIARWALIGAAPCTIVIPTPLQLRHYPRKLEIAIVEFGEDVVMWVLDHVLEKVRADRGLQADRFLRYASLLALVVREWKRQGKGARGCHWWAVRKMWDELGLAGREYEYTACAPFGQWPRMDCEPFQSRLSHCWYVRGCACGSVSKWSWGRVGGLWACAEAPGVVCEAKKVLDA